MGIVIVIVMILVVLLFPVTIRARSSGSEGIIDGSLSVSWLILAIQYELKDKQTDILILGRTLIHSQYKEKTPETKDIEKSVESRSIPQVKNFTPIIGPLMRLIRDLLSIFKFRHFKLDTVYGLEDPAYTGMLTGYLHALPCQYNISFTPDFTQPVLDWDLDLATAFTPITVVVPITRFATNPGVLRSGWRLIRS
ncbi:MAG TPA: DUF2953 domain-containing protein [Methanosarcinales archaeon]|nr:DUF2953 domain-containing protein [Methanosarcinales archaeon]